MGVPQARWMVYFMENPNIKWMITGVAPWLKKPPYISILKAGPFQTFAGWCPSSLAKLVQISPITRVYRWYIYSFHGDYNLFITGGHHLVQLFMWKATRKHLPSSENRLPMTTPKSTVWLITTFPLSFGGTPWYHEHPWTSSIIFGISRDFGQNHSRPAILPYLGVPHSFTILIWLRFTNFSSFFWVARLVPADFKSLGFNSTRWCPIVS